MLQKNQKTIKVIATIIGVLSLLLFSTLIALYSLIDPIGPIFLYFVIPFVFVSFMFGHHGGLIAKVFAALLVLSCCLALWTASHLEDQSSAILVNKDIFILCSNAMFEGVNEKQTELTQQQKSDFDTCVKQ